MGMHVFVGPFSAMMDCGGKQRVQKYQGAVQLRTAGDGRGDPRGGPSIREEDQRIFQTFHRE